MEQTVAAESDRGVWDLNDEDSEETSVEGHDETMAVPQVSTTSERVSLTGPEKRLRAPTLFSATVREGKVSVEKAYQRSRKQARKARQEGVVEKQSEKYPGIKNKALEIREIALQHTSKELGDGTQREGGARGPASVLSVRKEDLPVADLPFIGRRLKAAGEDTKPVTLDDLRALDFTINAWDGM